MPELPEVETVRRIVGSQAEGLTVSEVELRQPRIVEGSDPDSFRASLIGRRAGMMRRRGKRLWLPLDDGSSLRIHLGMTGRLLFVPDGRPEERHTHLVIRFAEGGELRFADPRRFGRVGVGAGDPPEVSGLGPEPDDPAMDADYLLGRLGRSRRAVKACIMDQSVIAGIGNIYADEILFSAGVRPDSPACGLAHGDWERVSESARGIIRMFIEAEAVTPEEYLVTGGREYRGSELLRAYGRGGLPCVVCGTPMVRTVVGGRGSTYCPMCQRLCP